MWAENLNRCFFLLAIWRQVLPLHAAETIIAGAENTDFKGKSSQRGSHVGPQEWSSGSSRKSTDSGVRLGPSCQSWTSHKCWVSVIQSIKWGYLDIPHEMWGGRTKGYMQRAEQSTRLRVCTQKMVVIIVIIIFVIIMMMMVCLNACCRRMGFSWADLSSRKPGLTTLGISDYFLHDFSQVT